MVTSSLHDTAPRAVTFHGRDGLRLVGDRRGSASAPPVLLLHGSGQSRYSWSAAATALAAGGWQTVTLDLRGHGASGRAAGGAYRLDDFTHDVMAVVEALAAPPVLIGASMGGSLALLATAELGPGRVRGIVLADSTHRSDDAGQADLTAFARGAAEGYRTPEDACRALASLQLGSSDPPHPDRVRPLLQEADGRFWWPWDPGFARLWAEVGDEDRAANAASILEAAQRVDSPMLLVRGGASRVVTEEIAAEFRAAVPSVQYRELAGVGHMLTGDDNDAFIEAIEPFLAELRDPA